MGKGGRSGWDDDKALLIELAQPVPTGRGDSAAMHDPDEQARRAESERPDWRGQWAPRSGKKTLVSEDNWYLVPTVSQVGLYKKLRGAADPNTLYRGEIAERIAELLHPGDILAGMSVDRGETVRGRTRRLQRNESRRAKYARGASFRSTQLPAGFKAKMRRELKTK